MKNILKKLITLSLAFCLCFSIGTMAFASVFVEEKISDNNSIANETIEDSFATMTNDELNQYIDNIMYLSTSKSTNARTIASSSINVKLAWLAAAQIARNMGYPCAATAVECSVNNTPYIETNYGTFYKKIITTSVFKSHFAKVRANQYVPNSFVLTKSDNADLFYALHNVNIRINKNLAAYSINITDIFNFALDNNYDSLFTSSVNNWAWLCQQTNVLNEIPITISFVIHM